MFKVLVPYAFWNGEIKYYIYFTNNIDHLPIGSTIVFEQEINMFNTDNDFLQRNFEDLFAYNLLYTFPVEKQIRNLAEQIAILIEENRQLKTEINKIKRASYKFSKMIE